MEYTSTQPPVQTDSTFAAQQQAQATTYDRLAQANKDLRQLIDELDLLDGGPSVEDKTDISNLGLRALIADTGDLAAIATSRVVELRADLKQL